MPTTLWPVEAGRVVNSTLTTDGFGDAVMQTRIADAPYHSANRKDLLIHTWEDGEVTSSADVELPLCGDAHNQRLPVAESLLTDELFEGSTLDQVDRYLAEQWGYILDRDS